MAKINILFDEVNYKVEESSMSEHSNELKTHISTVMNGSGSAVKFGGTSYNIDSTKLSNTTNDFVSYLGTIAGSGRKVIVGGTQYNASSEKLTSAIDELHAILSGLHSEDEDSDLGELNEYGFYYDTKYSYYDNGEYAYYYRENNTVDIYVNGEHSETANVAYSNNHISINHSDGWEEPYDVFCDGKELYDGYYKCKLGDSVFVDGDYTYAFYCCNILGNNYEGEELFGWVASVNDKTKSSYGEIRSDRPDGYPIVLFNTFAGCTNLTETPVIPSNVTYLGSTFKNCTGLTTAPVIPNGVTIMESTFKGCTGLTTAPVIPNGVTYLRWTFQDCTNLTEAPAIPSSVTDMTATFKNCTSLTTAPAIPSSVTNMTMTFSECTGLTGEIEINANPVSYYQCFFRVNSWNYTIVGSCTEETKIALKRTIN